MYMYVYIAGLAAVEKRPIAFVKDAARKKVDWKAKPRMRGPSVKAKERHFGSIFQERHPERKLR